MLTALGKTLALTKLPIGLVSHFFRGSLSLQIGWDSSSNHKVAQPLHRFSSGLAGGFIFSRCLLNAISPIGLRYAARDIAYDLVIALGGCNSALLSRVEVVFQ